MLVDKLAAASLRFQGVCEEDFDKVLNVVHPNCMVFVPNIAD